jgi:sulfur carrier protein
LTPGATILLNGTRRPLAPGAKVMRLVEEVVAGEGREGIAVAVNGAVVPRPEWSTKELHDGDSIEIVRAVQGG